MKAICFFDVDDTLVPFGLNDIREQEKKILNQLLKNGHYIFVNTGRTRSFIPNFLLNFPFSGYAAGCGTYIEYNKQEMFHIEINENMRKMIIQKSCEYQIDTVLEGKNAVYFPKVIYHQDVKHIKERYIQEGFDVFEYTQDDVVMFDKFASWYTHISDIEAFKSVIKNDFDIIQRDVDFIEVVPLPYSKATGIQMITDYCNNTIDNTISIGDSTNDLPMLTYTKEAVAMGNSNPILFDKVTYITTDINNDGIYNALKHFHII